MRNNFNDKEYVLVLQKKEGEWCSCKPWMWSIQIFLLFLIVLGLGLLVIQNMWVPKVVECILSQETR